MRDCRFLLSQFKRFWVALIFLNILSILLQLLATLPVRTVEAEKVFSKVERNLNNNDLNKTRRSNLLKIHIALTRT